LLVKGGWRCKQSKPLPRVRQGFSAALRRMRPLWHTLRRNRRGRRSKRKRKRLKKEKEQSNLLTTDTGVAPRMSPLSHSGHVDRGAMERERGKRERERGRGRGRGREAGTYV
jgi:hypothetical protein